MGKSKKLKVLKTDRNNPLARQIIESELPKQNTRVKARNRHDEDEVFVDNKLSKKILEQALEQQEELEEEFEYNSAHKLTAKLEGVSLRCPVSDEESDKEEDEHSSVHHTGSAPEIKVSEEDEKAFELFMNKNSSECTSLAEIIKEKLTEKKTELQSQCSDAGSSKLLENKKLMHVLRGCGEVLARYRSGKVPKALKGIPSMYYWEQALAVTEPENWSAAALYQATRIFASNLKDHMAQKFYISVLLPRLRDDITQCKKLNFHLYQALKKSLFKPAAFFKGIVIPLCEAGDCTLREATIISSVIAKFSIPVLHSSVAIMRIADMDYTGANSIFLRVLLEKKYALPFRTVDAVVAHFLRFSLDKRALPLLWHQCLLTFAQRYKNDISSEQQESLLSLLPVHSHPLVTPEIRRELLSAQYRISNTMECESKPEIN